MHPAVRLLVRFAFAAGVVIGCAGVATAQAPPPPTSVADLFVPVAPGLVAADFCDVDGAQPAGLPACSFGTGGAVFPSSNSPLRADATGWLYLDANQTLTGGTCVTGSSVSPLTESRLYRVSPQGSPELLGSFRDVCAQGFVRSALFHASDLDAINGLLYLKLLAQNYSDTGSANREIIVRISGLPSLLDIILSYQPPSTLSFNVPVRPEGLPGADSFSLYAGDVRTAADLSQAVPLQCAVPAGRAPVPGEHLTVADTLPDPLPGDARYYLAAVNYQGQRRAGRSSVDGVLRGRNAAALPACQ